MLQQQTSRREFCGQECGGSSWAGRAGSAYPRRPLQHIHTLVYSLYHSRIVRLLAFEARLLHIMAVLIRTPSTSSSYFSTSFGTAAVRSLPKLLVHMQSQHHHPSTGVTAVLRTSYALPYNTVSKIGIIIPTRYHALDPNQGEDRLACNKRSQSPLEYTWRALLNLHDSAYTAYVARGVYGSTFLEDAAAPCSLDGLINCCRPPSHPLLTERMVYLLDIVRLTDEWPVERTKCTVCSWDSTPSLFSGTVISEGSRIFLAFISPLLNALLSKLVVLIPACHHT